MATAPRAVQARDRVPTRPIPEPVWPVRAPSLPAPRRLAALLTLGRLLQSADGTPAPRVASWADTIGLADELLVTPALWVVVERFPGHVPEVVRESLRNAQRANTVRNMRLRSQLAETVTALNWHGIVPLLLKGARQLVDGSLPRLGDRWLTDLDLAVLPEQREAARAALATIGYRELPDPFEHPHARRRADRGNL